MDEVDVPAALATTAGARRALQADGYELFPRAPDPYSIFRVPGMWLWREQPVLLDGPQTPQAAMEFFKLADEPGDRIGGVRLRFESRTILAFTALVEISRHIFGKHPKTGKWCSQSASRQSRLETGSHVK